MASLAKEFVDASVKHAATTYKNLFMRSHFLEGGCKDAKYTSKGPSCLREWKRLQIDPDVNEDSAV